MRPDGFSYQFVQSELRLHLPFFAVASIVVAAGISALALAALRSRERLLYWLGIFSLLYGVRLFLENGLLPTLLGVDGARLLPWAMCLTFLIPIPYASFAREWFGVGWRQSIRIWVWVQIAFALIAIPFVVSGHDWRWADALNGYLVIAGTLLMLLHVVFPRESPSASDKRLAWPFLIAGIFVLLNNWGYRPAGWNVEPLGFLILLAGLGVKASRSAVERERKLTEVEQELKTARQIQSAIIPHSSPAIPGLRIATRYQPMTAVAGDFFDFLKSSETTLTILVADVSGHGVPAALVASMLKVSFAAQRERAANPAAVLAGLNAMLCGSLGGQYVTAACAALDRHLRTITYSGAGHPAGLLLRKNHGDVLPLQENGLFIGQFPHATYSNICVPFETGDRLLLHTDGILEAAMSDGQEFGQARVEQLLLRTTHLQPAQFIEELFQNISTPPQQDDLTAVLTQFE
jgi:sigma-B regulation protein RsbU (phosphoserine phosphatase)